MIPAKQQGLVSHLWRLKPVYSRNKHFDVFADPDFRAATKIVRRMRNCRDALVREVNRGAQIVIEEDDRGMWVCAVRGSALTRFHFSAAEFALFQEDGVVQQLLTHLPNQKSAAS
jgi:hypothetical protein